MPVLPSRTALQELYERFLELANGQPVQRAHAEVAMGRHLEIPRAGEPQAAATLLLYPRLWQPAAACVPVRRASTSGRRHAACTRLTWPTCWMVY